MPTTIRSHDPRELLSLIPYQLGFRPQESAVLVSLRGERGRTGLVARVDLADLADPEHGPHVARSLVGHLVDDGAARAVLVVYTAADARSGAGRRTAQQTLDNLERAGEHFLGPWSCWVVGPTGYHGLECEDTGCCPPGGRPLSELESTQVSAGMVAEGVPVVASRADLARIVPAPAEARRSARRAAARWADRARGSRTTSDLSRWRREGLMLWRRELERARREAGEPVVSGRLEGEGADRRPHRWQPPPAPVLGRLRTALEDVLVRDAALLSFVPGADRLAERVAAGDVGPDVGAALQTIVDPVRGRAPERVTLAAAQALLVEVAAHAPQTARAPSLTLLGVLAWWDGDGARAGVLLEQALAADPEHRLALLVTEALDHGMPPGWLRRGVVRGRT